jgi:hypothetical protein
VLAGIEPIPLSEAPLAPDYLDAPVGTYSMMDVVLWPWTASVRRITDTLRLDFPDIYGTALLLGDDIPLQHLARDVFIPQAQSLLLGQNGVDFAFIRDPADETRVRYMRNRFGVGQRVGQFPERVAIEGDTCVPVAFKSELDMPVLSIAASGLVTPTRLVSVPLSADNPGDPSSAKVRHPFTVGEGGATMAYAVADTEPDDMVVLLLLRDADGDGVFTYPTEVVASAYDGVGTSILNVAVPLAAGDYQLWAWGVAVNGAQSYMDLDLTVMQGQNLRLENQPRGLADGAIWTMRVCAEGVNDFTEPMNGMIQFSYDSPPRLFRIPVDWSPRAVPPALFLPLALDTHALR